MKKTNGWIVFLVASTLAGHAMAGETPSGGTGTPTTPTTPSMPGMPTTPVTPTGAQQQGMLQLDQYPIRADGEVASVLRVLHDTQIQGAELARTRATSPDVRRFAEQMITDHTAANKSLGDVVKRANITSADNDLSKRLNADQETFMAQLKNAKGAEFDRLYMDHEVQMHQQAVYVIDQSLLPNATSADLRAQVSTVRPTFNSHLDQARKIRSQLKVGPT